MKTNTATTALRYVAVTSALTKKALDEVGVHRAGQQKAAAVRPALLTRMVEVGTVAPHQKQAVDVMLSSHAETLGLLKSAVDKIAELQTKLAAAELLAGDGAPEGEVKTANDKGYQQGRYSSVEDPYVGRKTGEKKASDVAILQVLNAPAGR